MKTVRIQYFALLREQRGVSEESVTTGAGSPGELYRDLRKLHRFTLPQDRLRVAINEAFGSWDAELRDGDTLVFIPPVAGG